MLERDKNMVNKDFELSNLLRVYECDLRLHPLTIKQLIINFKKRFKS